ncbi:hypothetical protein BH10PAT3_BH10PAT3_1600 [soil metagenome]
MKRFFFIDCQILQTAAYDRGMGKYSLSLLKALGENRIFKNLYDPVLIFSENLDKSRERLKDIEKQTGIKKNIIANLPVDISIGLVEKKRQAVKEITAHISKYLKTDEHADFMSMAPFFVGFPSVFPDIKNMRKMSIVYDVIPYLIWQKQRIFPDDIYFDHFKFLFEADLLFGISASVTNDLTALLGIDSVRVCNINGGAFEVHGPDGTAADIKSPFIIYPSAPIIHKNNITAVKAFKLFNKTHGNRYKLVLTSTFSPEIQGSLQRISSDIIFSGNVSDRELATLYKKAEAVFFASLAEGLGMPVLEAVIYGKPVACSDIVVLTEMSNEAFYLFDPTKPEEMARALSAAINGVDWNNKKALYPEIKAKYQWERSAQDITKALEKLPAVKPIGKRKYVDIICPHPGSYDAVRQLAEQLYGELYKLYDVHVRFYGKYHTPKIPAFMEHYESRRKDAHPDFTLLIGNVPKSERSRTDNNLHITVKNFHAILRRRGDMELNAVPVILHGALEVKTWQYALPGSNRNFRTKVLNVIKDRMG